MNKESLNENLKQYFPCRKQKIDLLLSLFNLSPAITSLFIYGHASTGKTTSIKLVLNHLEHILITVNIIECYSLRILFESILKQLQPNNVVEENKKRCDNSNDFIKSIKASFEKYFSRDQCIYILLENSERLRDINSSLLPMFLKLQELAAINIGVILESQIVWEKFRSGTGFREPIVLHFNDYNNEELLEILNLDCPSDCPPEAYSNYVSLLLNVFHLACNNLSELRYLASVNFYKYKEPVLKGEASFNNSIKLWKNIEPHLKKALQSVYLREVSGDRWMKMQTDLLELKEDSEKGQMPRQTIELPVYTKYLLIASYLASYNPAKWDRRFFVKNAGKVRKSTLDALKKRNERTSCQVLGPKYFTLDRMMAIFYSIVEDKVVPSANTFSQISSLVTLGMLVQSSTTDILEGVKYKCVVPLEHVKSVARSVGFELLRYLFDFL